MPIPGSPPMRTSEPGTMPPPRTRSSSPLPVDSRRGSGSTASLRAPARPQRAGRGVGGGRRAHRLALLGHGVPAAAARAAPQPAGRAVGAFLADEDGPYPAQRHPFPPLTPCHWRRLRRRRRRARRLLRQPALDFHGRLAAVGCSGDGLAVAPVLGVAGTNTPGRLVVAPGACGRSPASSISTWPAKMSVLGWWPMATNTASQAMSRVFTGLDVAGATRSTALVVARCSSTTLFQMNSILGFWQRPLLHDLAGPQLSRRWTTSPCWRTW